MLRLLVLGGLGNQLFQYAAVRAQAKRLGVELIIDPRYCGQHLPKNPPLWLHKLPLRARVIDYPRSGPWQAHSLPRRVARRLTRELCWRRYAQPHLTEDSGFFAIRPRTIVSGCFESLFYLLPRDEEILAELDLRAVASAQAVEFAAQIACGEYVSVHVRRGDWLIQPERHAFDVEAYLAAAMDLVRSRLGRPRFLVFSNDVDACKKWILFARDCEFVETNQFGPNPAIDLWLMSVCSHHILANSTYSWWAAWIGYDQQKLVVLPKQWFVDRSSQSLGLVHPNWITV